MRSKRKAGIRRWDNYYFVKGKRKKGFRQFHLPNKNPPGVKDGFALYLPVYSGKNWDESIVDVNKKKNILIRTWQGLIEVHLPEQFHRLSKQKKQALSNGLITWKLKWIFNNLAGLGKLSPRKGRICFADLIISLDSFFSHKKRHNNKLPLLNVEVNGLKFNLYDIDVGWALHLLKGAGSESRRLWPPKSKAKS